MAGLLGSLSLAAVVPGPPLHAGESSFSFLLKARNAVSDEAVSIVRPAPDGRWFAVASNRELRTFSIEPSGSLQPGLVVLVAGGRISGVAVSQDGSKLAAVDTHGALYLYEAASMEAVAVVETGHRGGASDVAFTVDGALVLTGGHRGDVRVWTPEGLAFARLEADLGDDAPIIAIAGVPPAHHFLTIGGNRQVVLWNADTQRIRRRTQLEMDVTSVSLGAGGQTLVVGLESLTGNRFRSATFPSAHEIRSEDMVRLIDVTTGAQVKDLPEQGQRIAAVGVSPDERFVAAGGTGEYVTVWESATGDVIARIPLEAPLSALAFWPDGEWMVTGTEAGEIFLLGLTGVGPALGPEPKRQILLIIIEPDGLAISRGEREEPISSVETSTLKIKGRISAPTPLKTLQVAGREITSITADGSGDYFFTAFVPLPAPGRRQIPIVVEDQGGQRLEEHFTVDRATRVPSPDPGKGRRIALIVGVSEYRDASVNLRYADDDARAIFDLLTSPGLGPATFKREDVRLLLNEQATVTGINTGLRDFLQRATEKDFVLFFFAGHGVPDPNRLTDLYLMAHDTDPENISGTGILMRHVREEISRIRARDVLILTDACHSAGIAAPESFRGITVNPIHETFLKRLRHASGGLAILTASEAAQISVEGERWGSHGVFTYYLLQGLKGAADEDRDRIVTLGELMEFVREGVRVDTESRQVPAIGATSFDRQLPLAIANER